MEVFVNSRKIPWRGSRKYFPKSSRKILLLDVFSKFWLVEFSKKSGSRKKQILEKKSGFRKNIRFSKIPLYREFSYENFEMSWFAKVTSSSISKLSDLEKITIFSKKWVFEKMCYVLDNVSFRKTKIKIIEIVQDR